MERQILNFVKVVGVAALLLGAGTASADDTVVDFTSKAWVDAVNVGGSTGSVTVDGVTVKSVTGDALTANSSSRERSGCASAQTFHVLACKGDGIGVRDDEVTQGGIQQLLVSFEATVDIFNIDLLDLFAKEGSGETAVIFDTVNGKTSFTASTAALAAKNDGSLAANNDSGFLSTGYQVSGVNSITFSGNVDSFSDYALARIFMRDAASVPEINGAQSALVFAFMAGLFAIRRERKLKK